MQPNRLGRALLSNGSTRWKKCSTAGSASRSGGQHRNQTQLRPQGTMRPRIAIRHTKSVGGASRTLTPHADSEWIDLAAAA